MKNFIKSKISFKRVNVFKNKLFRLFCYKNTGDISNKHRIINTGNKQNFAKKKPVKNTQFINDEFSEIDNKYKNKDEDLDISIENYKNLGKEIITEYDPEDIEDQIANKSISK